MSTRNYALAALTCLPIILSAQKVTIKNVNTGISSAIIYLDGAEISRKKSITLATGRNELTFKNLSPRLNSRSIQVTASSDVPILAISSKINYLTKAQEKPKIKQLKDSVELVNKKMAQLNDEKGAYETERQMLMKNEAIGGQDQGVSITELKQAAEFYRSRITDINVRLSGIQRKLKKLNLDHSRIGNQLRELNAQYNYQRGEITVLLSTPSAKTIDIELRYIVANAGWAPTYDLIGSDVDKPIELKYRAKVFNNTSIDWKNIKMKLSTGDPTLSAAQPKMTPWYLNYSSNVATYKAAQGYMNAPTTAYDMSRSSIGKKEIKKDNIVFEEIEVSELSAEFEIKTKYDIPSDSKPYIVEVAEYKLPASYKHFTIPKIDRDVFLLARITGWENLNLVEGPANVYYGGTYIGQSYIYTRSTSDTLDLSLGRDKKVIITRVKSKEFSKTKVIGSNKKETWAYNMVIKNNRKGPIQIEVQDQLPVSQSSDIEVTVIDISEAKQDVNTGKLEWNYTVAPGQTQKIYLAFSMKYPKSKPINVSKSRKQYRARF